MNEGRLLKYWRANDATSFGWALISSFKNSCRASPILAGTLRVWRRAKAAMWFNAATGFNALSSLLPSNQFQVKIRFLRSFFTVVSQSSYSLERKRMMCRDERALRCSLLLSRIRHHWWLKQYLLSFPDSAARTLHVLCVISKTDPTKLTDERCFLFNFLYFTQLHPSIMDPGVMEIQHNRFENMVP